MRRVQALVHLTARKSRAYTLPISGRCGILLGSRCAFGGLLRQYCDEIGRDSASIVRTHGPDCRVFDSEADLKKWLDSPTGGSLWGRGDPDEYVRDNFVGTAEQVAEKVQGFVDAGCGEFVLWFRDFPESDSLEAMIRDVAPQIS